MKRLKIILCSCLAAVFAVTACCYAQMEYKTRIKVEGTKLVIHRFVEGKGKIKDAAVLLNKDNKIVARWKQRSSGSWYYDATKYFRFIPYTLDMKKLPSGRYRLVSTTTFADKKVVKKTTNIAYKPKRMMTYRSTKIVRNDNGDVFQRLYFKKNNSAGQMCYAQIFDKNNKLVHSVKYKAKNADQDFAFSWNGWGRGNSGKKCPKGIYTVKYWMDDVNPKTAKFRLSI